MKAIARMKYGQLVRFVCVGRQVEGRVILGCTQGPTGLVPIEIPGTIRIKYRCPVRGTLGDIQLPVSKVMAVRRVEQLELFVIPKQASSAVVGIESRTVRSRQ